MDCSHRGFESRHTNKFCGANALQKADCMKNISRDVGSAGVLHG